MTVSGQLCLKHTEDIRVDNQTLDMGQQFLFHYAAIIQNTNSDKVISCNEKYNSYCVDLECWLPLCVLSHFMF